MASGFDSSVSRIQPRTKKQFFRPKISDNKPYEPEKISRVASVVLKKEMDEMDALQESVTVKKTEEKKNIISGNKITSGDTASVRDNVRTKRRVPVQKKEDIPDKKATVSESSVTPMKIYSIHGNRVSDNEEEIKPHSNDTSDSTGSQLDPQVESNGNRDHFETYHHSGNETENETDEQIKETSLSSSSDSISIQDRYKSLKKRLDSFANEDQGNSGKKYKAYENADTIKNVIRGYQSKIRRLTEELAAIEDTFKFTRDELEIVRQDLYKKSLSLEQATKLGQEKTALSEEILKEMEIAVFERDRAFTTIAELKTVNKSNEELLENASISLEEKAREVEEGKIREKELLKAIESKDGEINKLQLVLAKRTADRDELFDRLEELSIQLDEIDKSNNALNEIKLLIDRDEKGLLE